MEAIISHDSFRIVFGLAWGTAKLRPKAEAKAFCKSHKATYVLRGVLAGKQRFAVAISGKATLGAAKKAKILSAAVLFATWTNKSNQVASSNHLLAYGIDDDRVALIAIIGGNPYLDVVLPRPELAGRVVELQTETGAQFILHAYGIAPESLPEASPFVPQNLVRGDIRLATMSKVADTSLLKIVAVALLAIGAVAGKEWWAAEKKRLAEIEAQKNKPDPVKLYRDNLRTLLADAAFTGNAAVTSIWVPISSIELTTAGWALDRIDCVRIVCKSIWKRVTGTNAEFHQAAPGSQVIYLPDGNTIERRQTIKPAIETIDPAKLPRKEPFVLALSSVGQERKPLGLAYAIRPPDIYGVPAGIPVGSVPADVAVLKGEVDIEGPIGYMPEILAQLPANVAVKQISLDFKSGVPTSKFKITGDYFVR